MTTARRSVRGTVERFPGTCRLPVGVGVADDAANVLAVQHVLVAVVDLLEPVLAGDHVIQVKLAGLVHRQQLWDVVLRVAAAEDGALQVLLHQGQHPEVQVHVVVHQAADSGQHAGPAFGGDGHVTVDVGAVQLSDGHHDLVGHQTVGDVRHAGQRGVDIRVNVRRAELQRLVTLPLHRVDREDVAGAGVDGTLQGCHADPADADDGDVVARPDVGGADRRTVAGGHAATHQGGHLEGHRRVDLHHRGAVHHH